MPAAAYLLPHPTNACPHCYPLPSQTITLGRTLAHTLNSFRQKKKLIQTTSHFHLTSREKKKPPSQPNSIQPNPIQSSPILLHHHHHPTNKQNPMAKSARASPFPPSLLLPPAARKPKRETNAKQAVRNPTMPASARPSSRRQMQRARSGFPSVY